jgi:signal transduction histidine kinase
MRDLVEELCDVLGFQPDLSLDAPLEAVSEDLADDVVLAAREALTNVARHARAERVRVAVTLTDAEIVLVVEDNGVGIGAAKRRSGLINLYERARRHGGTCRVTAAPDGGTCVEWRGRLVFDPVTAPAR